MTASERLRLAKHFLSMGQKDHPYVIEFADQLKVKPEEIRQIQEEKRQKKELSKATEKKVARLKAEAEEAKKQAVILTAEAEKAAGED